MKSLIITITLCLSILGLTVGYIIAFNSLSFNQAGCGIIILIIGWIILACIENN